MTLVPTKGVVLEKKSYSIDVSEDVMAGSLLAKIDGGTCNNFTIVSGDCVSWEGGREGGGRRGREGEREGGREGGREGRREGEREGGRGYCKL